MNVALPERRLRTLHLFAGAGGGILADLLLGHVPVCAVENAPYPRSVLLARQRDGILPRFPIWDDVVTFNGKPWRGHVDVVAGGFPCQDISAAGRGEGITGVRSGLWSEMARIIGEVRPRFVLVENSPILTSRGLGTVLGDLASMGYDARWGVLGAIHAGAPHQRERIWIRAEIRNAPGSGLQDRATQTVGEPGAHSQLKRSDWWKAEPALDRVVNVLPRRVDRIICLGNAQVPSVAALAWHILSP